MESREVEKKRTKTTVVLGIFLVLVIIATVLILNLFKEKVTNTSTDDKDTGTISVSCTTKNKVIPDGFFSFADAESANQTIKATFKDNKIDNISYSVSAIYSNAELADKRNAELHFDYGEFVQKNDKEMSEFSPNFYTADTESRITLYATMKQLNNALIKLFAINTNDSLSSYTPKVVANLYAEKGFDCEIKE